MLRLVLMIVISTMAMSMMLEMMIVTICCRRLRRSPPAPYVLAGNSEAALCSDAEKDAQKSIQNRSKILPKSFKIEVWNGIGQLLGASGLQEASQKSTKNLAKIFQTMQKKSTEIHLKSTKNHAKIYEN